MFGGGRYYYDSNIPWSTWPRHMIQLKLWSFHGRAKLVQAVLTSNKGPTARTWSCWTVTDNGFVTKTSAWSLDDELLMSSVISSCPVFQRPWANNCRCARHFSQHWSGWEVQKPLGCGHFPQNAHPGSVWICNSNMFKLGKLKWIMIYQDSSIPRNMQKFAEPTGKTHPPRLRTRQRAATASHPAVATSC